MTVVKEIVFNLDQKNYHVISEWYSTRIILCLIIQTIVGFSCKQDNQEVYE